jgi:hypothetical protein
MGDLNIKSSTIEKSLDLAKGFLQTLVGPSVEELGLLLSDNVKLWRLKNQIRNLEKVKNIVDKENIDVKQVNLKVLIPYLEGVSLEEDETLQNLWANLFVNYIDSKKNLTINVYPNILKQLSTNEVKILNYMQSHEGRLQYGGYNADKNIQVNSEEIANLERLGVVKEFLELIQYGGQPDDNNGQWKWDIDEDSSGIFYITDFGYEFLRACERKSETQPAT